MRARTRRFFSAFPTRCVQARTYTLGYLQERNEVAQPSKGLGRVLCGDDDKRNAAALKTNIHMWESSSSAVPDLRGHMDTPRAKRYQFLKEYYQLLDTWEKGKPTCRRQDGRRGGHHATRQLSSRPEFPRTPCYVESVSLVDHSSSFSFASLCSASPK